MSIMKKLFRILNNILFGFAAIGLMKVGIYFITSDEMIPEYMRIASGIFLFLFGLLNGLVLLLDFEITFEQKKDKESKL